MRSHWRMVVVVWAAALVWLTGILLAAGLAVGLLLASVVAWTALTLIRWLRRLGQSSDNRGHAHRAWIDPPPS